MGLPAAALLPSVDGLQLLRAVTAALLALGIAALVAVLKGRPGPATSNLWTHLSELRRRLIVCILAVVAATLFAFSFSIQRIGGYPVPVPGIQENLAAQAYRWLARLLVPDDVQLIVTRPLDGFSVELTLAVAIGAVLASPIIVSQISAFLVPALRPREALALRRAVLPIVLMFVAGAAVGLFLVAPPLLATLYDYPAALGAAPLLLVRELVSFALMLALLFGVAFQTPYVMYALSRSGLVSPAGYLAAWRHATVGVVILAALATDGTIITLAMVCLPLLGLYFLGIAVARHGWKLAQAPN